MHVSIHWCYAGVGASEQKVELILQSSPIISQEGAAPGVLVLLAHSASFKPFFFKEFATIKFVVCCTTSKLTVFMYECVLFCFGGCVLSHFILIH